MEEYNINYKITKGKSVRGVSVHDLTNSKFGRLTVIKYLGQKLNTPRKGKQIWLCKCDCGNYIKAVGDELIRGHTTSCGCKLKERCIKNSEKLKKKQKIKTHGACGLDWYKNNYKNMLNRIFNKKYHANSHYLNNIQGELIEKSWLDNPWNFYNDIGEKPSKNYTIDRIDPRKGYVKGNVRWATKLTQSRNRFFYSSSNKGLPVGISFNRSSKSKISKKSPYEASIGNGNKTIYLGVFKNLEDAKKCRYDAETKLGYRHTFVRPCDK